MPYLGIWPRPLEEWAPTAKKIEKLGYDTLLQCDHFYRANYDPVAMLASAAAATTTLRLGTLVFNVDYRHPVVLAQVAASLYLLSGGRYEFGLGAGWAKSEYEKVGIRFNAPAARIQRLEEALQIIKSMWTDDQTTFTGKQYTVRQVDKAGDFPEGQRPKILVGGGGRKVLSVAGRHADTVGINMSVPGGSLAEAIRSQSMEALRMKVGWARAAARRVGRDPDGLEYQLHIPWVGLTDDPEKAYGQLAERFNLTLDEVVGCPQIMYGSGDEIRSRLRQLTRETSVTYFTFGLMDDSAFTEFAQSVIGPIKGQLWI
ncbi:MAG: TIGR03621 family F420-dependent LLM class oxidoreductase [Candidatus Bathyarchaeota archaeon]